MSINGSSTLIVIFGFHSAVPASPVCDSCAVYGVESRNLQIIESTWKDVVCYVCTQEWSGHLCYGSWCHTQIVRLTSDYCFVYSTTINPLITSDYSHHRNSAACYLLVQSVLKIGSALALFPSSRAWAVRKEPGTHCLRMLSFPRISGDLEISRKTCSVTLTSARTPTSLI